MTTDNENLNAEEELLEETEADAETTEEVEEATAEETTEETEATGEGEEEAKEEAADPRDQKIAELQTQVQQMNGRVGSERGTRNILNKVIKELEKKEGAVNRDELAQSLGIDRPRLDGILDAPAIDDSGAFNQRCNLAERNLKAVSSVLKANGRNADDIINTYGTLLNVSAEERERFMSLPENELVEHIISVSTEQEGKMKPLVKAKGNVMTALDDAQSRIAELEAENLALKEGKEEKPPSQPRKQRVQLNGSAPVAARTGNGAGSATATVLG
jgi:hypothetical protein